MNTSTFTLAGASAITGAVTLSSNGLTATFTPAAALASNTTYTATITTTAASASGAALSAQYTWSFTTVAAGTPTAVNFGSTYQTIRGFGGSTAWLGQLTAEQATALFSPSGGLGLSILRVRIDPAGSAANNWVTSNWEQELNNALEARMANPNAIVFATPWTAPASMKTDASVLYNSCGGEGEGYCGGSLNTTDYAAYAAYLEDFVSYFDSSGAPLYAISMQNEPDESTTYESCVWTGAQMDTWVASLTAGGATNPITTKLMMPESAVFNTAYSDPTLNDPNVVGNVSIVGGHLYMNGTNQGSPYFYTNAENAGKDVWMTEHYLTPVSGSTIALPTITDALDAAEEVHNSLVTGGYNAYVWWWIWNDTNDAINYGLIDSNTTTPTPTYYGYAIGQFSKFVQPGFVRAFATANPENNVFISAYTGNGHYVIVVINQNASAVSQQFTIQGATLTSVIPYQTTANGGLQQLSAISVSGGQFAATLPAQSITTFYQ